MPRSEPIGMATMIRPPLTWGRGLARLCVTGFLAVVFGLVAYGGGPAPQGEDPLPLARIAVAPDQLAQLKQGTLVKLPREEFEAQVRRAARAGAAQKTVARVVRAHYLAELQL